MAYPKTKQTPGVFARFLSFFSLYFLLSILVIMVRHAGYGFSFVGIHKVLHPFQRNHVNYAAMLTLFSPYLYFTWRRQRRFSNTWWFLLGGGVLFLLAIYLSYTRAAYVALLIVVGAYGVFRLRLIRPLIAAACVVSLLGLGYLVQKNRYLDYAPNYDRTVTHYEFDNLVEATYKMEDISTMERLYRWVAGLRMSPEEPWVGFGPGNFVNFYESYTVTSFRTYVSDNPERSGIHSYFLMTLVEQGIIGLLLFLTFGFYLLIAGERIYHQTKDPERKWLVMSVLLSLVAIDAFLIINDLLETDKVGPFYFMGAALLAVLDRMNDSKAA
jgi:O-antigen ligase